MALQADIDFSCVYCEGNAVRNDATSNSQRYHIRCKSCNKEYEISIEFKARYEDLALNRISKSIREHLQKKINKNECLLEGDLGKILDR